MPSETPTNALTPLLFKNRRPSFKIQIWKTNICIISIKRSRYIFLKRKEERLNENSATTTSIYKSKLRAKSFHKATVQRKRLTSRADSRDQVLKRGNRWDTNCEASLLHHALKSRSHDLLCPWSARTDM